MAYIKPGDFTHLSGFVFLFIKKILTSLKEIILLLVI